MELAIGEFFGAATSVYQHVADARDPASNHTNKVASQFDVVELTAHIESLAAVLDPVDYPAKTSPSLRLLGQGCWKISQDLLIRLRRLSSTGSQETTASQDQKTGIQDVFSESDLHNLHARLYELKESWELHKSGSTETLPDITLALSRINIEQSFNGTGTDGADSEPERAPKGVPARTASFSLLKEFILESLSFKSMRNREEEVAEAHGTTFEWIFNRDKATDETRSKLGDHFVSWLRSNDLGSIYWITGKPGSGKSTLMRFLSDHTATNELLHEWAGDTQLARANFYFWTSGSQEQRSQTGLLRYLLYQLLDFDRDLIPGTFPDLWTKLMNMTTKERIRLTLDWTSQELIVAFRRFINNAIPTMKVFLFVDGLDEFDGDHNSIIHFFKDLVEGKNSSRIKLCLSSRPWKVFEQAFQTSVPNLKLQDLTFQDMYRYVDDHLHSDGRLRKIIRQDTVAKNALVQTTVERADGVFLWARLVVRNILFKFAGHSTSIRDINAFVDDLPTDLEELFSKLLFVQSKDRQTDIAHIFQLMRAREIVADFIKDESANSLTIWEMAFALDSTEDASALERSPKELTDQEIVDRGIKTRVLLVNCSVGLLEIYSSKLGGNKAKSAHFPTKASLEKDARSLAAARVTYLHRTVRDYLMLSPGIWTRFIANSAPDFDPHLCLLRSYILRLKSPQEEIEHHRRHDEWWPDIALALTHARYIDSARDADHLQTILINALNDTISFYWAAREGDPYDHWARSNFGGYEARKGNKIIFPDPFLALCTKIGLETYVIDRLAEMSIAKPDSQYSFEEEFGSDALVEQTPLLTYALEFLTSRQKTIYPLSSLSFVNGLLSYSNTQNMRLKRLVGTPNSLYNSQMTRLSAITPWIATLRHLRDGKRRGWIESFDIRETGTQRWTGIVKLLLEKGAADKEAIVQKDSWDPEVNAKGVIVGTLGDIGDHWICELGRFFGEHSVNTGTLSLAIDISTRLPTKHWEGR